MDNEPHDELAIYDEQATRHNRAFMAFRSVYITQFPPPELPPVERDSIFVPIALIVMILASVVVSGSRTIVEFGGGFVGISAFVMLEGAIIAYAFFHTRTDFQDSRIENVRKWALAGLILSIVVAVVANIHAVLKSQGIEITEWINTGILLSVAVSAPMLAFISGDIMALETMRGAYKMRKAREAHAVLMEKWTSDFNAAWSRSKGKWGAKIDIQQADGRPDNHLIRPPMLSAVRPERTDMDSPNHGSGQGYSKRTDARTIIWEHLIANPSDADLTVRELADRVGVGKSTVAEVLKTYRQNGHNGNGHE